MKSSSDDSLVEAMARAVRTYALAKWGDKDGWCISRPADNGYGKAITVLGTREEAQHQCDLLNANAALTAQRAFKRENEGRRD